ncbi:MAG: hypothetical protein J1E62_04025 [Lachnospiraceae bacterium]|nr:hypothetical protein [Lachnospiraceae bacterium]
MEKKIWMNYLLDAVRKDAIRKSRGKEVTGQVYAAIFQLLKLQEVARKNGLLALEDEMKDELENGKLEPELNSITILPIGIQYMVDGTELEILVKILTTKYWVKNPQGMEALAYFICIQGVVMIQEGEPTYYLEGLLTALLPEECIAEYERRKEERMLDQPSKTHMEMLLEEEVDLPRRSIIIRNVLEEKINQASESVMKAGMQKLENDGAVHVALILRGLSKAGKKKTLSCISRIRRDAILEMEEHMGPVRTIDIEDAMVKFLECFEETEDENAAG